MGVYAYRYNYILQQLCDDGCLVFGMDHRGISPLSSPFVGHGSSDGVRCYVKDYHDFVNDQVEFINAMLARDECAGLPVFTMVCLAPSPHSPGPLPRRRPLYPRLRGHQGEDQRRPHSLPLYVSLGLLMPRRDAPSQREAHETPRRRPPPHLPSSSRDQARCGWSLPQQRQQRDLRPRLPRLPGYTHSPHPHP